MIPTLYEPFRHWAEKGSVYILSDLHFDDADCKFMSPDWITPQEQIAIINVLSVAFMFSIHTNKNELTVSFLVFEDEFMVNMHGKVTMGNETSTYREFKYKRRFIIINFISSRVNGSLVV